MPKLVFVHLLNDYSGSPKVLSVVIREMLKKGHDIDVITSNTTSGALSKLDVNYHLLPYQFHASFVKRLIAFLWFQLLCFMKCLSYPAGTTFYINTLLPFGAALGAKIRGQKVVYHLHESSVKPAYFKGFLKFIARITANKAIYVSEFLKSSEQLNRVNGIVAYNALSEEFLMEAGHRLTQEKPSRFTVLMLCSLKLYKGVEEFVTLADRLPGTQFKLVLNASIEEVQNYFMDRVLPTNLVVFPVQKKVGWFYQNAHLVVNLSHPDKWKETFGLTLLEGMAYRLPVIAPPAGGPCELVKEGENGYLINPMDINKLANTIQKLQNDKEQYNKLATHAGQFAKQFTLDKMMKAISPILDPYKNFNHPGVYATA